MVLDCTASCHLTRGEDRWWNSCLFLAFTSDVKLQLLRSIQQIQWDLNLELADN